jgi:hypothetical protein
VQLRLYRAGPRRLVLRLGAGLREARPELVDLLSQRRGAAGAARGLLLLEGLLLRALELRAQRPDVVAGLPGLGLRVLDRLPRRLHVRLELRAIAHAGGELGFRGASGEEEADRREDADESEESEESGHGGCAPVEDPAN